MRVVIVPEFDHFRVPFERRLDDAALDAAAAAVDDPDLVQAGGSSRVDVFVDDRGDVARTEGVEIDLVLDGNANRFVSHSVSPEPEPCAPQPFLVYSAVTTDLMPPRTEKSPTTVMRRGWSDATRSSRIWLVTCS